MPDSEVLQCTQCDNTETPPYAEGDGCYCGGVFIESLPDAEVKDGTP